MNVVYLLVPAVLLYALAHRFYAPFLGRVFGEDEARLTPAVARQDGVDYVPTRPHVLFAHHFSAIAAAGPIVGPTMAVLYGYVPAILWIVIGAVFIGAVHDFACLFVSIREGGRSIAEIARKTMGNTAFVLFALFIVFNLVVVNAVFINLTAVSLTSLRTPADLGLPDDQTIFRTIVDPADGQKKAVVGGIASASAIALTVVAPILGFLVVKRGMRELFAYPIATTLCIGSVLFGFAYPVAVPGLDLGLVTLDSTQAWIVLIALYVWLAAAVPVWLILQPREFVSVQFLYLGILLLLVALVSAGLKGHLLQAPPAEIEVGEHNLGSLWPTLFVTIACGAVSGFHGLVGSGTTAKQIVRESHAKHIGYLAMLGESALALCVTLAIAGGVSYGQYTSLMVKPEGAVNWKANPVLAFSVGVAGICERGLGIPPWLGVVFGLLMVEGFVLDTLDVSIRLNRYLLEEIRATVFKARITFRGSYWIDSGISVFLMLALAYRNTAHELWPIFGTGNQLLAALSLLTVSIWLFKRRRPVVFVLLPAMVVGATTFGSLIYLLLWKYWPANPVTGERNYLLAATDVVFITLAVGVCILAFRSLKRRRGLSAC